MPVPEYIVTILTAVVTAVVGFAAGVWYVTRKEIQSALGVDKWTLVENVAGLAVEFAERAGVISAVKLDAEEKLKLAVEFANKQLKSLNISLDAQSLVDLIEAILWREKNQFKDERTHPRYKQENEIR